MSFEGEPNPLMAHARGKRAEAPSEPTEAEKAELNDLAAEWADSVEETDQTTTEVANDSAEGDERIAA